MLVMGAAFGAVVGLVGALLIELLARRVRGMEDLESTIEAPVLAIVSNEEPRGGWLRKWLNPREPDGIRSEEPTSELQSLMRISYAVFCLKKTKLPTSNHQNLHTT